jgi:large subunit ribosomal protein L18
MKRIKGRTRRHKRIRKKISGTEDIPRLVIHRSLKNLHAQLVDDLAHKTILSASTNEPYIKKEIKYGGNVKAASALGIFIAKKSLDKGIKRVVFDRSGYVFHGRIKALADGVQKGGLLFGKEKKESAKIGGK